MNRRQVPDRITRSQNIHRHPRNSTRAPLIIGPMAVAIFGLQNDVSPSSAFGHINYGNASRMYSDLVNEPKQETGRQKRTQGPCQKRIRRAQLE